MTITDPAHVHAAAALRHAYQHLHHHPRTQLDAASLVRDLADYDKTFGINAHDMIADNMMEMAPR
jgi:hypothetical protein